MFTFMLFRPKMKHVARFDPALNLPESITAHRDGNLYVSLTRGIILRIRRDHTIEPVAVVPLAERSVATGIKVGPDGKLYVASAPDPTKAPPQDPAAASVWRISLGDGTVQKFATLNLHGFPNDLAFDGAGNLFVTDSKLGRVWKIEPSGAASNFLTDTRLEGNGTPAFGANGIAFDAGRRALYVSNQDFAKIYRIPIGANPPALQQFAADPLLEGAEGLAFDQRGTLYAAVNRQDHLVTVDGHGHVSVLAKGLLLDAPASIVFGTAGADRHQLFVANFAINRVIANNPKDPAKPGVIVLHVKTPGLPLA